MNYMTIECDQCNTVFKVDKSKVPDKGARAKCKKCGATILIPKKFVPSKSSCPKCGAETIMGKGICDKCLLSAKSQIKPKTTPVPSTDNTPQRQQKNHTDANKMTKTARIVYFLLLGFGLNIMLLSISALSGWNFNVIMMILFENLPVIGGALWVGWSLNNKTARLGLTKIPYIVLCSSYLFVANIISFFHWSISDEGIKLIILGLLVIVAYLFTWVAIKAYTLKQTS